MALTSTDIIGRSGERETGLAGEERRAKRRAADRSGGIEGE